MLQGSDGIFRGAGILPCAPVGDDLVADKFILHYPEGILPGLSLAGIFQHHLIPLALRFSRQGFAEAEVMILVDGEKPGIFAGKFYAGRQLPGRGTILPISRLSGLKVKLVRVTTWAAAASEKKKTATKTAASRDTNDNFILTFTLDIRH